MKINKITSIITAVLLSLLITSCGGGAGGAGGEGGANAPEGTITLNFGSGQNARAAAPTSDVLAQLTYTVQLKGPAVVTAGPTKKGEQRLTVTAPVGTYTLTVTATLDGKQYAEGTVNNVKIEAGKTTAVKVTMTLADGSDFIIITDFDGSSIADFKAWLDALPSNNTPETAYNAKLNVDSLGPQGIGVPGNIRYAIGYDSNKKYLNLDLSDSTFTVIMESAFFLTDYLVSVILPDNVTIINNNAFTSCSRLTSINLPKNVLTIGNAVFSDCTGLTSITIPGSVTTIGIQAFEKCTNLTTVTFGTGSNIDELKFGSDAFPQGTSGDGGNNLKIAYLNVAPPDVPAGTYKRTNTGLSTSDWTKQ